jgi:hypothetical protein
MRMVVMRILEVFAPELISRAPISKSSLQSLLILSSWESVMNGLCLDREISEKKRNIFTKQTGGD